MENGPSVFFGTKSISFSNAWAHRGRHRQFLDFQLSQIFPFKSNSSALSLRNRLFFHLEYYFTSKNAKIEVCLVITMPKALSVPQVSEEQLPSPILPLLIRFWHLV
jgi:hypothetical protein